MMLLIFVHIIFKQYVSNTPVFYNVACLIASAMQGLSFLYDVGILSYFYTFQVNNLPLPLPQLRHQVCRLPMKSGKRL